jgi:hypothetical protein
MMHLHLNKKLTLSGFEKKTVSVFFMSFLGFRQIIHSSMDISCLYTYFRHSVSSNGTCFCMSFSSYRRSRSIPINSLNARFAHTNLVDEYYRSLYTHSRVIYLLSIYRLHWTSVI